jgi:hypothetical protein
MRDWRRAGDWGEGLVFVGALALYVKTLSPGVYTFDSAELAAGAYSLGIVHATGYPLYLMLAKVFTLFAPFGDVAYRVNLFSAMCAALALVVLRRLIFKFTASPSASLLATAILGLSYPFWSEAVVAEVYTLHILFLLASLLLALRWRDSGLAADFVLLNFIFGLSFGNHMSTILLTPGLGLLILKRPPPLRLWLAGVAAFAIGPLTYLYLPIRYAANPALNFAPLLGVDLSTLRGVIWMMRGEMFADSMFGYRPVELPGEIFQFLELLMVTFFGVGVVTAAIGAREQWRRDRVLFISLSLITGTNAIFYINYRVFDKDTMFLPVFVVISLWLGVGLKVLSERSPVVRWGAMAGLALMLIVNYPRVDLSGNTITREFAMRQLHVVPPNAVIVGGWIDITPLQYLQVVEGIRPDVTLFDFGLYTLGRRAALRAQDLDEVAQQAIIEAEVLRLVTEDLAAGRTVFTLGPIPLLEKRFSLTAVTTERELFQVEPTRSSMASGMAPGPEGCKSAPVDKPARPNRNCVDDNRRRPDWHNRHLDESTSRSRD